MSRFVDRLFSEDISLTIGKRSGIRVKYIIYMYDPSNPYAITGILISPMNINGEKFNELYHWNCGLTDGSSIPPVTVQYRGKSVTRMTFSALYKDDPQLWGLGERVTKVDVACKTVKTFDPHGNVYIHNYSKRGNVILYDTIEVNGTGIHSIKF